MRKVMAIAGTRLLQFMKQPVAIIMMFVMPLLFTAIFGSLLAEDQTNNRPHVAIVGSDDPIVLEVTRLLMDNEQFIWELQAQEEATAKVQERKAIAAIVINDSILAQLEAAQPIFDVIVQQKSGDYITLVPVIEGIGRLVYTTYNASADKSVDAIQKLLSKITHSGMIDINHRAGSSEDGSFTYANLSSLGFTIMFMMFGISNAAAAILEERAEGTWSRLITTPTKKIEIMLGYLLSFFLMGWIQFGVLMIAMTVFFGVHWGNLTVLIPFASLLIFTVVGFGLMMAGIVRSRQQAGALSAIVIVSTCMIGGVYWPIEITPTVMQMLAKGVPQSWAISGFQEIIGGGLSTSVLLSSTLMLLFFAIVFLTIGLVRIKFE